MRGRRSCAVAVAPLVVALLSFPTVATAQVSSRGARTAATCHGKAATIVGTAGDDTIQGTAGDDVIVSLGGNDTIYTNGGNDDVCAGTGDDQVNPLVFPTGSAWISGGAGRDSLQGPQGFDRIDGGGGPDSIYPGLVDSVMFPHFGGVASFDSSCP